MIWFSSMSTWVFILLSACFCSNCDAWTTSHTPLHNQPHRWAISGRVESGEHPGVFFGARFTDHICKEDAGRDAVATKEDQVLLDRRMAQLVGFLDRALNEIEQVQEAKTDNFISTSGWMKASWETTRRDIAFEPTAEKERNIFGLVHQKTEDQRMMVTVVKEHGERGVVTWVITHAGPFSQTKWNEYDEKKSLALALAQKVAEGHGAAFDRAVDETQLHLKRALEAANQHVHQRLLIHEMKGVEMYNEAIRQINGLPGVKQPIEIAMYRRQIQANVQDLQFYTTRGQLWDITDLDQAREIIGRLKESGSAARLGAWGDWPKYEKEIEKIERGGARKRRSTKAAK